MKIKIATWNVNSLKVRLPHLLQWCNESQPDVLVIQETKLMDDLFPKKEIEEAGFQVIFKGQKTYNGVAILSKHAMSDVLGDVPQIEDPQRRILVSTIQGIRVINLYVPNGESISSEKYAYKLAWLENITQFIQEQLKQYKYLIVTGDFNIAPEDRDVHSPIVWQNKVLFSQPERLALQKIMQLGMQDCFRLFEQPEKSYTWWDYRMLAFRRNHGLRIDHILASPSLAAHCQSCMIDKNPRRWERPSDHAPVMACFDI
jgi:exodeoxyribonuclease-3